MQPTSTLPAEPLSFQSDDKGNFVRKDSTFRDFISSKPGSKFPPEMDRYHIYVNLACPWANGVLSIIELKGLQKVFTVSNTRPEWGTVNDKGRQGWVFDKTANTPRWEAIDHVYDVKSIYDVYRKVVPTFEDKATVPILFDKKTKTIVNNESIEIMKMINSEFEMFAEKKGLNFYPDHLQREIEDNYDWIYNNINNGVYKSGFATTQEAYNAAFTSLFDSLDRADAMLDGKQYLIGNQLTLLDIRLFMTLIRFDPVYVVHFKCNKKTIESYKNLNRFVRHIYHDVGLKKVVDMDHIKRHYYGSHQHLNWKFIVPIGPDAWWEELPEGQVPIGNNLKNFLVEVAQGERDLEDARQQLCAMQDFAPTAAYSRIDRLSQGKVSYIEICQFLRENGIHQVTETEVQNLITFYDMNGDKTLPYDEWIQIFLTCENFQLRQNTMVRYSPTLSRNEFLPQGVELAICNVIAKEIIYQRKVENLKHGLYPEEAFNLIAENNTEINSLNAANFLESEGYKASDLELMALIRRMDKDGDSVISKEEFIEFLTPLQREIPIRAFSSQYSPMRTQGIPARTYSELRFAPSSTYSPMKPRSPLRKSQVKFEDTQSGFRASRNNDILPYRRPYQTSTYWSPSLGKFI